MDQKYFLKNFHYFIEYENKRHAWTYSLLGLISSQLLGFYTHSLLFSAFSAYALFRLFSHFRAFIGWRKMRDLSIQSLVHYTPSMDLDQQVEQLLIKQGLPWKGDEDLSDDVLFQLQEHYKLLEWVQHYKRARMMAYYYPCTFQLNPSHSLFISKEQKPLSKE